MDEWKPDMATVKTKLNVDTDALKKIKLVAVAYSFVDRELFPNDEALCRWIRLASERVAFQGLPARICWLGYGERAKAGLAFNAAVARGEISAPIVIGRDHLDCGSVASPNRETEAMRDGTDAVAD